MFIDGWLIMRALGWQVAGAGMLAKHGIDTAKRNQSYKKEQNHYAPMREWWDRYGVPRSECDRFETAYMRSIGRVDGPELKNQVLERLRECVHTDDPYVNSLLRTGGTDMVGQTRVVVMYYASMGRAAQFWVTADSRFPMAGSLDSKPGLKAVVIQLMKDNGVRDTHWFLDPIQDQERYLSLLDK